MKTLLAAALTAALTVSHLPLQAQSLTAAGVSGAVRSAAGEPVFDAEVTVVEQAGGLPRHVTTNRAGTFRVGLLPPGRYDILVEMIGFKPVRVRNVPVTPGPDVAITVDLSPAPPPVESVDTVEYAGSALGGRGRGMSTRLSRMAIDDFGARYQDSRELLRHFSDVSDVAVRGTPAAGQMLVVDGVPFASARHPGISGAADLLAHPLVAMEHIELSPAPPDAELPGSSRGYLLADTRRGSNTLGFWSAGDWSGMPLAGSRFFAPGAVDHTSWRGSAAVSGPVMRDTAVFVAGVSVRREQTVFPALGVADSANLSLLQVAADSFGQDLGAYVQPAVSEEMAVSGFGRLDWQLTGTTGLTARVLVGSLTAEAPRLGERAPPSLGTKLTGTDVNVMAALTSTLFGKVAQEFRLGVGRSRRAWERGALPGTAVVSSALSIGGDARLPGTFTRTDLRASDAFHYAAGPHALKLSLEGAFSSFDNTYADDRAGSFTFGDASMFAQRRGTFSQAIGPPPVVTFALPRFAVGLQDDWTVGPGLVLTLAIRADNERLPVDRVDPNDSLLLVTGLENATLSTRRTTPSPRVGLTWDVGQRGAWIVRGGAGVYTDGADPALFGSLIVHSGRARHRSGLGVLSKWPALPDSTQAGVRGPSVVLTDSTLQAPRTRAASFGISRALGSSAAMHVSGVYQHVDYLPRRRDLNLLPAPASVDPNGRPILGVLQQLGSQVAVVPGSNRRFTTFDNIWAVNLDGYSDYWGATVALERETRTGVRLLASYTYSLTSDNWFSPGGGVAEQQLAPLPPAGIPGFFEQDWTAGPGDLDVPHHASVGLAIPMSPKRWGARLGVLFSYRSSYPFTPGFRDGVDANADGSATNDPAFVDESIAGTTDLYGAWDCLRRQGGQLATRNSCRGKGIASLDLQFRISPVNGTRFRAELVIEGMNLLDSDDAVVDRGLYLVDPSGTLSTTASGVTTIPLRINPNFGQPLYRLTSGRSVRVGIRILH